MGGGAGWKEGLAAVISSRDNGDGDSSDSNATGGIGGGATDGGRRFVSFCEGRLIRGEGKLFTSKRRVKLRTPKFSPNVGGPVRGKFCDQRLNFVPCSGKFWASNDVGGRVRVKFKGHPGGDRG